MTTPLIIWGTAFIIYAIFWLWYVGFRKPLTKEEIDHYIKKYQEFNNNSEAELIGIRDFFEKDTGKSFVMVNSILLKKKPDLVEGCLLYTSPSPRDRG